MTSYELELELKLLKLDTAPIWFNKAFKSIETAKNTYDAAKIAKEVLENSNYKLKLEVLYKDLDDAIKNTEAFSTDFWRNLYLIERSIPTSYASGKISCSWFNRLKIFNNTHKCEEYIINYIRIPDEIQHVDSNGKLYYRNYPGKGVKLNHSILRYGPGYDIADFYFWNAAGGEDQKDKCIDVDAKCIKFGETLENTIEAYRTSITGKASRHNAKYIIAYTSDLKKFYFVDYTFAEPKVIEVYPRG